MRTTTGKRMRERVVARSSRSPSPKMRMINGAKSMRRPVSAPSTIKHEPEEGRGHAPGARALLLLEQLAEDGHERGAEGRVRRERAHEVRDLERDGERVDLALDPEGAAGDDLAEEAEDARDPGDGREDRRRQREAPPWPTGRVRRVCLAHRAEDREAARATRPPATIADGPRGPFSRYAEHQAAEAPRLDRRPPAAREPALPLDREDALQAARDGGRRRRQGGGRPSRTASSSAASTGPPRTARSTRTGPRARSPRRLSSSPAPPSRSRSGTAP